MGSMRDTANADSDSISSLRPNDYPLHHDITQNRGKWSRRWRESNLRPKCLARKVARQGSGSATRTVPTSESTNERPALLDVLDFGDAFMGHPLDESAGTLTSGGDPYVYAM